MAYNSQDLLKQFGDFMMTFRQRGFSAFSKRGQQFWAKQPQRGQMRVLLLLNEKDQLTNSQIVDELDIRPSSVSVMVKKLEEEGLVERHDSTEDKRVSLISLTEKGKETITSSHNFKAEFSDELFDSLTKEEQETLGQLLNKLTTGLSEKFAKWDDGEERPDFLDHMPNAFFKGQKPQGWGGFKGNGFGHQGPRGGQFGPRPNGFDPHQDGFNPDRHN
ncbi:MarR family transcriptional regulator [Secundilactobacillus pentosiphilus]|uniref:MarR family transcriptional regulator n=1 Tax=Secundilactobacillus pentosiphilus TaxID=1714682 RepID=A0A1Z5IP26_9LACO|nr:MarR family winged helix-turn-helix transcriptional regulator [Secundilactobacillus pentosiphilus]GAX03495.1 MarR family transcriptional regulator [Secundilactobacillus pentosiphilus]